MGASGGMLGGARTEYHLRQVFVTLDIHPINKHGVIVYLKFEDGQWELLKNLVAC
jgi:NAD(P)H-dependent FMN reductase